jgi:dUTP pyrophosphatase
MLRMFKENPNAITPQFQTRGSACFDIHACLKGVENIKSVSYDGVMGKTWFTQDSVDIYPETTLIVPTGLIFDIPEGHSVRIHNRSSVPLKKGLILLNAQGIIDSDYVDPVFVMLHNYGKQIVKIEHGERIAQGELVKNLEYNIGVMNVKPERKTDRVGGLGSTGTH